MRGMITPERLAERVCRALDVPAKDNAESITEMLRTALTETRDRSIAASKSVSLEIAEDEAERSRGVGATAAQQTALTIAARIRKRHVEVKSSQTWVLPGAARPRVEGWHALASDTRRIPVNGGQQKATR